MESMTWHETLHIFSPDCAVPSGAHHHSHPYFRCFQARMDSMVYSVVRWARALVSDEDAVLEQLVCVANSARLVCLYSRCLLYRFVSLWRWATSWPSCVNRIVWRWEIQPNGLRCCLDTYIKLTPFLFFHIGLIGKMTYLQIYTKWFETKFIRVSRYFIPKSK